MRRFTEGKVTSFSAPLAPHGRSLKKPTVGRRCDLPWIASTTYHRFLKPPLNTSLGEGLSLRPKCARIRQPIPSANLRPQLRAQWAHKPPQVSVPTRSLSYRWGHLFLISPCYMPSLLAIGDSLGDPRHPAHHLAGAITSYLCGVQSFVKKVIMGVRIPGMISPPISMPSTAEVYPSR